MTKPTPLRTPAAKPAARAKPARKPDIFDAPVEHISQEDAVAKIQALLDAKQERVRQGPHWPDAVPAHPSGEVELHPPVADNGHGDGRVLAPQRGEQGKRNKD
jgi:hypothetical protein